MGVIETDVIVVGGGLAGLSAAARAAAAGLEVVLLEKQPRLGGSSAMSGGWFALADTDLQHRCGIADSGEAFLADMVATGAGYADEQLLRALVAQQHRAIEAISAAGAFTDEIKISAGMRVARAHLVQIGRLLAHLEAEARRHGARVLTANPVVDLIVDVADADPRGTVRGVRTADGEVAASLGVVLTTGGFSRSRALLDLFAPDQATAMPYGGVGNTGDGLRMAWALGAGLADVGHVSGTYGQHPKTTDEEHELLTANYLGAILVNARGERFADESDSYKVLGRAVLDQPGQIAYQVFDAAVRRLSRPVPLSDMDRIEQLGHLRRADSLAELAEKIDVDAGALARTVADYNAVVAGAPGDDPFGRRGLVSGVGALTPVAEPPFYAYPAVAAMTSTFGGITVGPDAGVRRIDGTRIAGLSAAGEVVGGFHGASYMTGTALTKALIFGAVAADAVTGTRAGTATSG